MNGRKDFENLIKILKEGDRLIFDSVSRMSRNSAEGCALYEELFNRGIDLIFLKEPHINSSVYKQAINNQIQINLNTGNKATDELMKNIIESLNKYSMALAREQIKIAFDQAEKEVADLHQRTRERNTNSQAQWQTDRATKGRKANYKEIKAS